MARKVEDSDDDFPGLANLLKSTIPRTDRKVAAASSTLEMTSVTSEKTTRLDPGLKSNERLGSGMGQVNGTEKDVIQSKKLKKKRVLKPRDDNPLLRPIMRDEVGTISGQKLDVSSTGANSITTKAMRVAGNVVQSGERSVADSLSDQSGHDDESDGQAEFEAQNDRRSNERPARSIMRPVTVNAEPEEDFDLESGGLSDFVVDDSTFLEDDSLLELSPPRLGRRLVKGRRASRDKSSDAEALNLKMGTLSMDDDVFGCVGKGSRNIVIGSGPTEEDNRYLERRSTGSSRIAEPKASGSRKKPPETTSQAQTSGSDIENPCTLRFSPSENKQRKFSKQTRFTTPPGSPESKSRGLKSPKKMPRIPLTPHRPSMDSFWSQDIINDWNDEFSPRKALKQQPKPFSPQDGGVLLFSKKDSPLKQDRTSRDTKKAFSKIKHEIAESFLKELDDRITGGQVANLAVSTGGVKIIWSRKLNTTAGRANWRRETLKPASLGLSATPTFRHHAAIELAEKVIDDEHRLLNVIAHEFCHLANFMVSNIKTNPHGKEFKAWAAKCSRAFGHRGVEVTTKHSYEIDYKYVWECVNCGIEYKRHSKSIDPGRHQCSACKSKLVQKKPVPRVTHGKTNEYQIFVKENMKRIREENQGSPQKEIMRLLGKGYQDDKASRLEGEKSLKSLIVDEAVGSQESTKEDHGIGFIARKLDFLGLTSP